MKRLTAVSALVALSAAPLAGCSPPTIGQLAIHRLGNGSLNAVIVGCEPGLQQVTAYVGELSDATPTAARWRLHVDPNTRLLVEWPLLGDDSTDVLAVSPLRQIPSHGEINLLASTADGEASATSIGLTPEELQRLPPRCVCLLRTQRRCPLQHPASLPCTRVLMTDLYTLSSARSLGQGRSLVAVTHLVQPWRSGLGYQRLARPVLLGSRLTGRDDVPTTVIHLHAWAKRSINGVRNQARAQLGTGPIAA